MVEEHRLASMNKFDDRSNELPTLCNYVSNTNAYSSDSWTISTGAAAQQLGLAGALQEYKYVEPAQGIDYSALARLKDEVDTKKKALAAQKLSLEPKKEIKKMSSARFVRVLIVDPDTNLPLDKRVVYKSEEFLTDLNDQELFYELEIKNILQEHNGLRAGTKDKKASAKKEQDVFLEPIRVRDLKMIVTCTAEF